MGQVFSLCNLQKEEEEITDDIERDKQTQELTQKLVASISGIEKDVEKRSRALDKECEKYKKAAIEDKKAGRKSDAILNMSKYKAAVAAKTKETNKLAMLFNQKLSIDSNINNLLIMKRLATATKTVLSQQTTVEDEDKLTENTLDVQDAKNNMDKMQVMLKTLSEAFSQTSDDSIYQSVESDDALFKELEALESGLDPPPKEAPIIALQDLDSVNRRNGSDPPPIKESGTMKSVYHESIEQRPLQTKPKTKKKAEAMLA